MAHDLFMNDIVYFSQRYGTAVGASGPGKTWFRVWRREGLFKDFRLFFIRWLLYEKPGIAYLHLFSYLFSGDGVQVIPSTFKPIPVERPGYFRIA